MKHAVLLVASVALSLFAVIVNVYLLGVRHGEAERAEWPSIWGYDCTRLDEPDANEVRCLKRYPTSYITFTRGGLLMEASRTNTTLNTAWTCGWHSPEAQRWIHWRDFDLHAAHEDREGLLCESNRLWKTTLFGGEVGEGSGFLVTKHGAGAYLGRVCRPIETRDTSALDCDESKARGSSQCREHAGFFSFPKGEAEQVSLVINCVSTDPKGCR